MNIIFEIVDKTGRKIRLTSKNWQHIIRKHPYIASCQDQIKETLSNPDNILDPQDIDEQKRYYYKYYKHRNSPNKFMLVVVKYLNGFGFVISAHFVRNQR